jgi:hypothetical protein
MINSAAADVQMTKQTFVKRSLTHDFRSPKTWWNFLTKEQKQDLRNLAEKPFDYDDLPSWSKTVVKEYFEENKELLQAEDSFLASVHPDREPTFPKPDLEVDLDPTIT